MNAHLDMETLSTYLDRELTRRRQEEVQGHLDRCDDCRRRLASFERVVGHLRALERQAPPSHLGAHLHRLAALEAAQESLADRLERGAQRIGLQSNIGPIFAVVLALVLIIYLLSWGIHRQEAGRIPVHLMPETGTQQEESLPTTSRQVAQRTFELVGEGLWVEQGLEAEPVSAELVASDPRVIDWLEADAARAGIASLGDRVRVRMDGEVVEIDFAGR